MVFNIMFWLLNYKLVVCFIIHSVSLTFFISLKDVSILRNISIFL